MRRSKQLQSLLGFMNWKVFSFPRALKFQTSESYLNFSPKLILSDGVFFLLLHRWWKDQFFKLSVSLTWIKYKFIDESFGYRTRKAQNQKAVLPFCWSQRNRGSAAKDHLLNEVMQQVASGGGQQLMLYNSVNKNTMHLATHAVLYVEEGCLFVSFNWFLHQLAYIF